MNYSLDFCKLLWNWFPAKAQRVLCPLMFYHVRGQACMRHKSWGREPGARKGNRTEIGWDLQRVSVKSSVES